MTWQTNLLTPAPTTRDGCSSQQMGIWNAAGQTIAAGMQSIALFD